MLSRLVKDFQQPSPHEGYDKILTLQPSDHPSPQYTLRDVLSILERLENSDVIHPGSSAVQFDPSNSSRGMYFPRGSRGGNPNGSTLRGTSRSRSRFSPYQNRGSRGRGRGRGTFPNDRSMTMQSSTPKRYWNTEIIHAAPY